MKKTIIACILAFMLGAGIVALVFLPDRAVDPVPIAETEDERLDGLFRQLYEESKESSYQHWKETQSFDFEKVDFKTQSCSFVSSTAYMVVNNYLIHHHDLAEAIEENKRKAQEYGESVLWDLEYEFILDAYESLNPTHIIRLDWDASDKFERKWEVRCLRAFREDRP